MPTDDNKRVIRLHFEGTETRGHVLPATFLVRSLEQVQRIIYLLAKFAQGDELGQRARVSRELERRFALICKVPEEGGYLLPAEIGDTRHMLFDKLLIEEVSGLFQSASLAIDSGDRAQWEALVPDHGYRNSVLKAFASTQPSRRTGLVFSIEDSSGRKLLNGVTASDRIASLNIRADVGGGYTPGYVTGALAKMDFDERRLHLKLLNAKTLIAGYGDDFEPVLLDHPRDLIQVHGNIRFDSNGSPESLTEVDEIVEVDESPYIIMDFHFNGEHFQSRPPLVFDVVFARDDLIYDASGPFGTIISEETRSSLEDALDENLLMLWEDYALEDDKNLTPRAQELAAEIRARFVKVSGMDEVESDGL